MIYLPDVTNEDVIDTTLQYDPLHILLDSNKQFLLYSVGFYTFIYTKNKKID